MGARRVPNFTFAVIADTHVNQREDHRPSYPSSALANARARYVIDDLNRLAPAFVIHLGDIVHPLPAQSAYVEAAKRFLELANGLNPDLYLVAGNHDVGEKPLEWCPVPGVTDAYLRLYEHHFGRHYYSFDHGDCHFSILNAQVLNSELACEAAQRVWLEDDLVAARGKRIFLCTHYPPYVSSPDESSSYDNIDEPARSWLLDLLIRYKVEALFAGHVHNFFYDRYAGTDCYVLPSTANVRHEYSEFFRASPGPEHGRNDRAKLGYFIVRVYHDEHVVEMVRTYGQTLSPSHVRRRVAHRVPAMHPREAGSTSIGVDLRHSWAETMEIPPSGASDEFGRKRARNDYPLLALWEMGIRRLRVPAQDLVCPKIRQRMDILRKNRHVFTVYVYGVPDDELTQIMVEHRQFVDACEVIVPWANVGSVLEKLKQLKLAARFPIYLSCVRTADAARFEGSKSLIVSHGFTLNECDRLRAFWATVRHGAIVDGFVFRVDRDASPWSQIRIADEVAAQMGALAMIYLRTSSERPTEKFTNDLANANRVAEAVTGGLMATRTHVIIDAFLDMDRGHFVRHGLIDRRCNPRLAGRVAKHLLATLEGGALCHESDEMHTVEGGRIGAIAHGTQRFYLLLPEDHITNLRLPIDPNTSNNGMQGQKIDLSTGIVQTLRWHARSSTRGGLPITTPSVSCKVPTLITLGPVEGRDDPPPDSLEQ